MAEFEFSPGLLAVPEINILLIDDTPGNLLSLCAILEDLGHNLVEKHSGEEALDCVKQEDFAVVLLDLNLPGLSGFETAIRLRESSRSRHVPIIFLTALEVEIEQIEQAYELGAVDFLTKPFNSVILKAKVKEFVQLFQEKERAKRETEQLRLLIENTQDYAIFQLDPTGHVVSWNAGAERLKGYLADEIIGRHFSCFYPQDAIDRHWPERELEIARSAGRLEDEGWRIRKDGTSFWANVVITPLLDPAGTLRGFSKITRDMSERKKAEESARRLIEETTARRVAEENALVISEQRELLRVTLSSIGDAVITTDEQGNITFLNPVAEKLTGWQSEQARGRTLLEVFHIVNETTRQTVENPAIRSLREGVIVGLANHTVLISKDGTERPIDDSAAPIRNTIGQVMGSVLVFRDVTEHRIAQLQLEASEAELADFFENATIGLHWVDANGIILRTNQAELDLLGYSADEVLGQPIGNFHVDQEAISDIMGRLLAGQKLIDYPAVLRCKDGSIKEVLISSSSLVKDGQFVHSRCFMRDVTERHRLERSLRFLADASSQLSQVIDYRSTLQKVAGLAVPQFADWCAMDMVDQDGSLRRLAVAHVDPAKVALAKELERRYPITPETFPGLYYVLGTSESRLVTDISTEMLAKRAQDEEHLQQLKDLRLRSYMIVAIKGRSQTLGVMSFGTADSGRNYTPDDLAFAEELAHRAAVAIENAQLYADLREADRRKDEFLATLAHELRNPLAPIHNSLQILKMPRLDVKTIDLTRDMMERQVQQLVRLVDDLLDVSRVMRGKIELRKEHVELAAIVSRAVETVQPLIDMNSHRLDLSLPAEPLLLNADPIRLAQVVGNLLANSAKYMDANGQIWLSAHQDGQQAVLTVCDLGIGIAPDILPHIFDLFVQADQTSTKAQGGLGIGLTLVKSLVTMHGGTIEVQSEGLGKGCQFVIRLPLVKEELALGAAHPESQIRPIAPISKRRLLVVDDNYDAAKSLAMLLELQGHDVRVAHDGKTGLELAATFRPDVIFLDLGMPGMDGYQAAELIRKTPRLAKTILAALTGWGQPEDRRRTAKVGFDYHLVKPPDPKLLVSLLAELESHPR